jgi:hypothetical protein
MKKEKRKGKERKGKERKGKERKGKERKGKERSCLSEFTNFHLQQSQESLRVRHIEDSEDECEHHRKVVNAAHSP